MRLSGGYNLLAGTLLTVLAESFHQYGMVLATFLIFNILDWITGTFKARFAGLESSAAGLRGICKKLGYWVLILVAFLAGHNLCALGGEIGVNLGAAGYIGLLTLAMLVVNEARSITENLVEMGVAVPQMFIKGLAIAQSKLDSSAEELSEDEDRENPQKEEDTEKQNR